MEHPHNHHNHLAPGAAPIIGRVFEAAAAREMAAVPEHRTPHGLPFVGEVLAYKPGVSITVARQLALEEDLFLADHNFVYAPGIKSLAECFPVVPMTVSLEIMADSAACLVPGYGLIGFEAVTARRWIAVADDGALALRVEGRVAQYDSRHGRARIAVQVYAGSVPTPAIESALLFGTHYDVAPNSAPQLDGAVAMSDATRLYADRHMFHGPRFQGLRGAIRLAADSASTELLVQSAHDWFESVSQPQLLTDPALLDCVGQLIGVWAMQHGGVTYPVGLQRLDLYGPTPASGTLVPLRVRVAGQQMKMLSADVEIGDGAGGLWLRIGGWRSWQFNWAPQMVAFQRRPANFLLSDTQALPEAPAGNLCQRLSAQRAAGLDLEVLARHCLHLSEMAEFAAKAAQPKRQLEWLLGRIAAKDAARAWSARAQGAALALHPAAFAIERNRAGQPRLRDWPHGQTAPCITIAHSDGQAIALASAVPAGIDIEQITAHDAYFLASFTTMAERQLLDAWRGAEHDAWITRLWCAKEAFGKRLGSGVDGTPRLFEAYALGADGSLCMRHLSSGTEARIVTIRDGEFIIAVDSPAATHELEQTPC
jgi:4'-phosphopantetheinyl transferase EntD